MFLCCEDLVDHRSLRVRRDGHVDHLDFGVLEQFLDRRVALRDAARLGHLGRLSGIVGGDRHDAVSGVLVRDQLYVADDKTRPDHSNGEVFGGGRRGVVVQHDGQNSH